jgi:CRP-like cAMP-binding protein
MHVVGILSEGDVFGEMSLFLAKPRTATVRAVTFCDVFELAREDLGERKRGLILKQNVNVNNSRVAR